MRTLIALVNIIVLCIFCEQAISQSNHVEQRSRKEIWGFSTGVAIPSGNLAVDNPSNPEAGLSTTGMYASIRYASFNEEQIGVEAGIHWAVNPLAKSIRESLDTAGFRHGSWVHTSFLLGLTYLIEDKSGLAITLGVSGGLTHSVRPRITRALFDSLGVLVETDNTTRGHGNAASYEFRMRALYPITNDIKLNVSLTYLKANPKIRYTSSTFINGIHFDLEKITYRQTVDIVSVGVGLVFKID